MRTPWAKAGIMHLLFGALAGALFAAVVTVGFSLLQGRKPDWKQVGLAALGGAVAGFVGAATLGVGGLATATAGRGAMSFALGGAAGGASERVAENAIDGRALHEGVGSATAVGAVAGLATFGVSKGFERIVPAVVSKVPALARFTPGEAPANPSIIRRLWDAPTPGTGGGWVRAWRERLDHQREVRAEQLAAAQQDAPRSVGMSRVLAGAY
jgi:hypothetical protein